MRIQRVLALAGVLSVGALHACSRVGSGIGGHCTYTEDCHSDIQSIPGSVCVDGLCKCVNPDEEHCCPGGSFENCELEGPNDYKCRPKEECVPSADAGADGGADAGDGG